VPQFELVRLYNIEPDQKLRYNFSNRVIVFAEPKPPNC